MRARWPNAVLTAAYETWAERELVKKAAAFVGMTTSGFIRETTVRRAEEILKKAKDVRRSA